MRSFPVTALVLSGIVFGCGSSDDSPLGQGGSSGNGAAGSGASAGSAGFGGTGVGGGNGGTVDPGTCGDNRCVLAAGENSGTCPADCGKPSGTGATARFFADFNSKAVEYGHKIRFTYVVWNEGTETAKNVVLPVPIVQNASTDIYGTRHYCETGGQKYDCLVDFSYVPGSMRINRVYHPNRARNSYYFVDTLPLTDAPDGDEGYFDSSRQILYLTLGSLRTRGSEPETAGLIWSYELLADGGVKHTPCEQKPRIQNWNYVFADNAEDYMNDIIGHVLCTAPRLRSTVQPDKASVGPGDSVSWTVSLSYDDAEPPDGIDKSRFTANRSWLYLNYPEDLLEIISLSKDKDATDLPGKEVPGQGGGVVFWKRMDAQGKNQMAPGESDSLLVTARVRDTAPSGSEIHLRAHVTSQNILDYQAVDSEGTTAVVGGPGVACGDGFCTAPETPADCSQDCPSCTEAGGTTSFSEPACCAGLTLVRASYPYSWAYDQCYDWEGGGVQLAQGFCVSCGDGTCKEPENVCNCPQDCGPHCGNWLCETGEDRASCPADC